MTENRRHLALLLSLDVEVVHDFNISSQKYLVVSGIALLSTLPDASKKGYITIEKLDEALLLLTELVEEWKVTGDLQRLSRGQALLSRLSWQEYHHFQEPQALKKTLGYLEDQDNTYRTIRSENAMLRGSRAFFARHLVSERIDAHEMYREGIRSSVAAWQTYGEKNRASFTSTEKVAQNQEAQELARDMIKWMQKSKARALTDLLGLEIYLRCLRGTNFEI